MKTQRIFLIAITVFGVLCFAVVKFLQEFQALNVGTPITYADLPGREKKADRLVTKVYSDITTQRKYLRKRENDAPVYIVVLDFDAKKVKNAHGLMTNLSGLASEQEEKHLRDHEMEALLLRRSQMFRNSK